MNVDGWFHRNFGVNIRMYGETVKIPHRFANVFRSVLELEQISWQNAWSDSLPRCKTRTNLAPIATTELCKNCANLKQIAPPT